MKNFHQITAAIVALGSSTLLLSFHVHAQDALGSGNALDRNFGVGTGGVNQPAAMPNFRDRNLIITWDVIGGRGFRGSVGYTAEYDFRGALGSNDTFDFRAQSAISSPQLFQNTLTYEQLRFGQDLGIMEYRRSGSGAPESISAQNPVGFAETRDRLRVDQRLRASALAMTQHESVEPRIVGATATQDGQLLVVNAAPVRGLTAELPGQMVSMLGLTNMDAARVREDVLDQGGKGRLLGAEFQTQFDFLRSEGALDSAAASKRVDGQTESDHTKILARIAERYAGRKDVQVEGAPSQDLVSDLTRDYRQLRDRLTGRPSDDKDDRSLTPDERVRQTEERDRASELPPSPGLPSTTPDDENEEDAKEPPVADYGAMLRHGERIEHLSESIRDRFNELVASAEEKLRAGEYITAEQRFERALRMVPGHPLASAGMANAQIGAGLYLSASFTLRDLLTRQPEMIDVEYDRELLPNPERMEKVIARLREHVQRDTADKANYAFLLAYLGHQLNDRALTEEGLNTMSAVDPENRLQPLLREIWLASETEKSPPNPQNPQAVPPAQSPSPEK